jgi:copper homeostasis protein
LLIEACVDSVESGIAAEAGGANRVELCDSLIEGGTTPSAGMIAVTREHLRITLHVMIRPRGGDFLYSDAEYKVMKRDIRTAATLGADGVVFGLLRADGTIDEERTAGLVDAARPLAVTFHRAFDMTRDPYEALDVLMRLGVERVLTSGQQPTALEGAELIRDLRIRTGNRIIIMPGGGVERHLERIVRITEADEVHVAGMKNVSSGMSFRNPHVFMGGALFPAEYSRQVTDADMIRRMRDTNAGGKES